ncbi:MAG: hypothetical protein ACP5H2_11860 [Solirubrobacteraceae bacterium]
MTLRSIMPVGAVPDRLRRAATRALGAHGRRWEEVTFAGTARLPPGGRIALEPQTDETWILAFHAGPLEVGDEIRATGAAGFMVSVPTMADGLIPAPGYHRALVCDTLERR